MVTKTSISVSVLSRNLTDIVVFIPFLKTTIKLQFVFLLRTMMTGKYFIVIDAINVNSDRNAVNVHPRFITLNPCRVIFHVAGKITLQPQKRQSLRIVAAILVTFCELSLPCFVSACIFFFSCPFLSISFHLLLPDFVFLYSLSFLFISSLLILSFSFAFWPTAALS